MNGVYDTSIGCAGKVRYASPQAAQSTSRHMRKRHQRYQRYEHRQESLQAYKCLHCKGRHLGHSHA